VIDSVLESHVLRAELEERIFRMPDVAAFRPTPP